MDKEVIKKVADIACLHLSEEEINGFLREFNEILENFKILDEVDTEDVKPSFHAFEIKNVLRKDEIKPGLSSEKALENTNNKEKGFFKGPKVV